jgi:hypothetical protein
MPLRPIPGREGHTDVKRIAGYGDGPFSARRYFQRFDALDRLGRSCISKASRPLGATLMISTENEDDFVRNLATFMVEKRCAFTVRRPQAFVYGAFPLGLPPRFLNLRRGDDGRAVRCHGNRTPYQPSGPVMSPTRTEARCRDAPGSFRFEIRESPTVPLA